ncbi:SRPBCC family protein [Isoptericola sp. NPDC019693]|uniref:SRPBCC family protein n=1 Tax=Isoptericola sp. NPDC019693 TaxID=3364009 RepID=UPI00379C235F
MPSLRRVLVTSSLAALGLGAALLTRRMTQTWGTAALEADLPLPGDDLVRGASVVATRAVGIGVPASRVWPWLVQLGYGRGGFYSHDRLERAVGLDIRSADRVEPAWQDLAVGDRVDLAGGFGLRVAALEPGRHIVLHGGEPGRGEPVAGSPPFDFSWAFVLLPWEGRDVGTRLLVRERYRPHGTVGRVVVEATQVASWVMSAAMLRGIRDRAEGRRARAARPAG